MIFFDQDSAYVFPGFPENIDQIVPAFIKRMKGLVKKMKIKTLEEVRERVERALKRVYPDSAVGMMIDIDDLYAINDALEVLKEQPQWISVKDRLPEIERSNHNESADCV